MVVADEQFREDVPWAQDDWLTYPLVIGAGQTGFHPEDPFYQNWRQLVQAAGFWKWLLLRKGIHFFWVVFPLAPFYEGELSFIHR